MSVHGEMLTEGIKDGIRHKIDNVLPGNKCGCSCPECGAPLIAKNKSKPGPHSKAHHFAHAKGYEVRRECRMTALHLRAQELLQRERKVMLPDYKTEYVAHKAELKEFDEVVLEQVWKDESSTRRPDCTCYRNESGTPLWVEIYCRHKVDSVREDDIKRKGVYCIEIDFNDLLESAYTEEDVLNRLTKDTKHRRWVSCPVWEKENQQNYEKHLAGLEKEEREAALRKNALIAEQQRLQKIVEEWLQKGDAETTNAVVAEIKRKPFANFDEDINDVCIYNYLVPSNDWVNAVKRFPKSENGKEVFYTLLRYYVRANLTTSTFSNNYWAISKISDILEQTKPTNASLILSEYLIVLWVLDQLEIDRVTYKRNGRLSKVFIKGEKIREYILKNIRNMGRNWIGYLSTKKAHDLIADKVKNCPEAHDVMAIIRICFPEPEKRLEPRTVGGNRNVETTETVWWESMYPTTPKK